MSYGNDQGFTSDEHGHDWALVLAGGEGSRLHELTRIASGISVPKQFCSLGAGASLLHSALQRAHGVAPPARTCVIVADHHRRWWQPLSLGLPAQNVIVQPCGRGTATGILLPLLQILRRDPGASLLILPSDHYVRKESVLASSLKRAMLHVRQNHDRILLLGFEPEAADPELGYIVAADKAAPGIGTVSRFVEKPSAAAARALIESGGLWNSFIFAARGETLLRAFEARCAETISEMRHILERPANGSLRQMRLVDLYQRLPEIDFSRDILQQSTARLEVLKVPSCGWSDLGTPLRVAEAVRRDRSIGRGAPMATPHARGFLDLAAQHLQLQAVR